MSSSDSEKHAADHVVDAGLDNAGLNITATDSAERAAIDAFTPAEQRKIIHRVDRRLVTTLGLLYAVSLMDRTNLGNVAIAG
jgi:hypothetical protein